MIKRPARIPMRDLSALTGEDAQTARKNRMGGRDLNIFRVLMNHPQLTKRWAVFAAHVLHKQTLPPRERELLILRIGWLNQAEYEWAQHVEIAKRSGISEDEIERIQRGPPRRGCATGARSSWPTRASSAERPSAASGPFR